MMVHDDLPDHFPPHVLELLALWHKANLRLAEVVPVTGVAELLQLGVLVVLVPRQVLQYLQPVDHGVQPLPQGLQLGCVEEEEEG